MSKTQERTLISINLKLDFIFIVQAFDRFIPTKFCYEIAKVLLIVLKNYCKRIHFSQG